MPSNSKWGQLLPIILLLLLQAFWAKTMLTPALPGAEPWIGLNWVDLLFHEAGHWIFALFGQMMQFLGGSIMQLAVPAIILVSFIKQQQWLGVAFGLFWQGESLINLSYYVKDARAQLLPLIGGEHDWAWILGHVSYTHLTLPTKRIV